MSVTPGTEPTPWEIVLQPAGGAWVACCPIANCDWYPMLSSAAVLCDSALAHAALAHPERGAPVLRIERAARGSLWDQAHREHPNDPYARSLRYRQLLEAHGYEPPTPAHKTPWIFRFVPQALRRKAMTAQPDKGIG